jgi:hypothetical protein
VLLAELLHGQAGTGLTQEANDLLLGVRFFIRPISVSVDRTLKLRATNPRGAPQILHDR